MFALGPHLPIQKGRSYRERPFFSGGLDLSIARLKFEPSGANLELTRQGYPAEQATSDAP